MSFASWSAASLLLLCALGCPSSPGPAAPKPDAGLPTGPTAILSFDPVTAIPCLTPDGGTPPPSSTCLYPTESLVLGLTLAGGPDARIAVWLEGAYGDASLDADALATKQGHATLTLRAASMETSFTVRARAEGALDAVLAVSVQADGEATIHVVASYMGHRPVGTVDASAFVETTCADLAKRALRDGSPAASGALASPIALSQIVPERPVAVQARMGSYATGCLDVPGLVPMSTRDVAVALVDMPMDLTATDLETTLSFEPATADATSWMATLDVAIARALAAFVPATATEAKTLLDAMRAAVPAASASAFDASRQQGGWDALTATWLGQHVPTMQDRATSYLNAGKPDTLGLFVAHLGPGSISGTATVTPQSFVLANRGTTVTAAAAGLGLSPAFAWTADAQDAVHLSGTLHAWPTMLVARAADAEAGATGVPGALASQIDCAGLAASLVGTMTSYPGCDATCTGLLCSAALTGMWTAAAGASAAAADDLPIAVTASAAATVDASARPTAFTGGWVGQVSPAGGAAFDMKGTAKGLRGAVPH